MWPPFYRFCLDQFAWRGSFLIQGGLTFHNAFTILVQTQRNNGECKFNGHDGGSALDSELLHNLEKESIGEGMASKEAHPGGGCLAKKY